MTLDDIESELINWGRWCRDTQSCYPKGFRCLSLESNWVSPQIWETDIPRKKPKDIPAERLEREIHNPDFPTLWRRILKTQYVTHYDLRAETPYRSSWLTIRARNAQVQPRTYEEQLQEARWWLADAL